MGPKVTAGTVLIFVSNITFATPVILSILLIHDATTRALGVPLKRGKPHLQSKFAHPGRGRCHTYDAFGHVLLENNVSVYAGHG
jgi:hypothetical protein